MRKKKTLRKGGISRALVVPPIAAGEGGLRAGAKAGDALALMATPADQGAASLAVYYNHNYIYIYIYIYIIRIYTYIWWGGALRQREEQRRSVLCVVAVKTSHWEIIAETTLTPVSRQGILYETLKL